MSTSIRKIYRDWTRICWNVWLNPKEISWMILSWWMSWISLRLNQKTFRLNWWTLKSKLRKSMKSENNIAQLLSVVQHSISVSSICPWFLGCTTPPLNNISVCSTSQSTNPKRNNNRANVLRRLSSTWLTMFTNMWTEDCSKETRLLTFSWFASRFWWQLRKLLMRMSTFSWREEPLWTSSPRGQDPLPSLLTKPGWIFWRWANITSEVTHSPSSETYLIACREMRHNGNNGLIEMILKTIPFLISKKE